MTTPDPRLVAAFMQGARAYRQTLTLAQNPYNPAPGSFSQLANLEWTRGWTAQQANSL